MDVLRFSSFILAIWALASMMSLIALVRRRSRSLRLLRMYASCFSIRSSRAACAASCRLTWAASYRTCSSSGLVCGWIRGAGAVAVSKLADTVAGEGASLSS